MNAQEVGQRLTLLLTVAAIAAWTALPAQATEFDCLIEPKRFVTVSGPVEALIAQVRVDRGDWVRKGDVLVEFESSVERASAELARFRAEMRGAVEARRARYEYAQLKHKRRAELVKEKFVSDQDLDEAEAERRLAEAELREAIDNQKLAEHEHRRAVEVLRTRTLFSPVSGVVVDRYMHPGEVSEMSRKPILRIAEVGVLNVEVILPIVAYRQIKRGDFAIVSPESPVGGRYEAKVTVVDNVLDASSGTFGVRLELPNPERLIPAGARCRVAFKGVTAPRPATPSRSSTP